MLLTFVLNNIVHACVPTTHNVHDTSVHGAPSEFLTLVS